MKDSGTTHQHFRRVVDALARQDEAEARRLYESCPEGSLDRWDAALDKVISFLVVHLLMAERKNPRPGEGGHGEEAAKSVADLLAAARTFGAGIDIPLGQMAAINPQLAELLDQLSPLAADRQPDPEQVRELTEGLRGCWESGD